MRGWCLLQAAEAVASFATPQTLRHTPSTAQISHAPPEAQVAFPKQAAQVSNAPPACLTCTFEGQVALLRWTASLCSSSAPEKLSLQSLKRDMRPSCGDFVKVQYACLPASAFINSIVTPRHI